MQGRDEEVLRKLLAMDASGVRRLPSPGMALKAADSLGISRKTDRPVVVLKFKASAEGTPVLKGRLLAIVEREFVLLDERTGTCWGVNRAKWEPIEVQTGFRQIPPLPGPDGGADPATGILTKRDAIAKTGNQRKRRRERKRAGRSGQRMAEPKRSSNHMRKKDAIRRGNASS